MREQIKSLITSLNELQSKTIGLFKPTFYRSAKFELVLSEEDGLLHNVIVGELGGLSENHIPKERGIFKRFPDNQTLWQMKSNPFALDEFIKSFEPKK